MDIFFLLLFGHSLADFALQSSEFQKKKYIKHNKETWMYNLSAHSIIHGGFVGFFTGSLFLSLLETVAHWVIDFGRMEGKYSVHVDQALHIACKVLWVGMLMKGMV